MSATVVNFVQARANRITEASVAATNLNRKITMDFARFLNDSVAQHSIDPVHQATLLMAKAIDVLAVAGPVPSSVHDQHARASNLLQSVFRARTEMLEKSVRIISAENLPCPHWGHDGISI